MRVTGPPSGLVHEAPLFPKDSLLTTAGGTDGENRF